MFAYADGAEEADFRFIKRNEISTDTHILSALNVDDDDDSSLSLYGHGYPVHADNTQNNRHCDISVNIEYSHTHAARVGLATRPLERRRVK